MNTEKEKAPRLIPEANENLKADAIVSAAVESGKEATAAGAGLDQSGTIHEGANPFWRNEGNGGRSFVTRDGKKRFIDSPDGVQVQTITKDGPLEPKFICGPLRVLSSAATKDSSCWMLNLWFKNVAGVEKRMMIERERLADVSDLTRSLLREGLEIPDIGGQNGNREI